jgi:hypothetical protein
MPGAFLIAVLRPASILLTMFITSAPEARSQETATPAPPADAVALSSAPPGYTPLSLSRRYEWAALSGVGSSRIIGYSISSALATMNNDPEEYGPHWQGFGKRLGMRGANGAVGTTIEASIGALWDEDPRYQRAVGQPFKKRLAHVAMMTFLARDRNGRLMPAYARYISAPASSYASNAWRPDSEANSREAAFRIPMQFLNRAIGNAFAEFWPDATKWLHRK